jgi:hypothetical protein
MESIHGLAAFIGGVLFTNGIPHFVSGVMGRPFQSPFAKPPGKGLSSSTVNVVWGFANFAAAYGVMCAAGSFDGHQTADTAAFAAGMLGFGVALARMFGRFHGGNAPGET